MQAKGFHKEAEKTWLWSTGTGGRHFYMRYGNYTLTLPGNKEYSVPQVKMLLNEIEHGIRKKISIEDWKKL